MVKNDKKQIFYNIAVILLSYFFFVIVIVPEFFEMPDVAEVLTKVGYGIFGFLYFILSLISE